MDGLRQQAQSFFWEHHKFDPSALSFDIIEITKQGSTEAIFRHSSALKEDLLRRLVSISNTGGVTSCASLQLVRIPRSRYEVLQIDPGLFRDLFDLYRIDPYCLYSVGLRKRGFQRYRSRSCANSSDYVDSFFYDTTTGLLLWSFDSSTKATRVILVPNHVGTVPDSAQVFEEISKCLEVHKDAVDTAFLMQLVSSVAMLAWIDKLVARSVTQVRQFEVQTQHGIWRSPHRPPPGLYDLVQTSRDIGLTMTSLANVSLHLDTVVGMLASDVVPESSAPFCSISSPDQSPEDRAKTALRAVQTQMAMRKPDIGYLLERAKTQLSVVLSLIGQKHTESSLEIATLTRADSASMKMLAFMATLFLPGTFFATLFAIPSLRWTEQVVITDRFWIYWAFVLPSTAFLLMVYKGWVPGSVVRLPKYQDALGLLSRK